MLLSSRKRKMIAVQFATDFNLDYVKVEEAIQIAPDFMFATELKSWLTQNMGIRR